MKYYHLYILECSDGLLYTGMTNDLERRLGEHHMGKNPRSFTFKRRPLKLIYRERFIDVRYCIYYEKKIKKWSAAKKRALANGEFDTIQILAECRNMTHHKYQPTKHEIDTAIKEF
ncbi:GIY-YIG nuclease family protein [Nonlabens sp. Asnod3-A02]|uniref:GIY-YIG nuclease family protein n=1 Tax=Nonlabens sp. Asnod3-A02 TaxID=3160579 RepID=UPI00386CB669